MPTEDQRNIVMLGVAAGFHQEDIANMIDPASGYPIDDPRRSTLPSRVPVKVLRQKFRPEIDRATDLANLKVMRNLFRIATGDGPGAVTAAIFWLKTRAGWRECRSDQRWPGGPDISPDKQTMVFTLKLDDEPPEG